MINREQLLNHLKKRCKTGYLRTAGPDWYEGDGVLDGIQVSISTFDLCDEFEWAILIYSRDFELSMKYNGETVEYCLSSETTCNTVEESEIQLSHAHTLLNKFSHLHKGL